MAKWKTWPDKKDYKACNWCKDWTVQYYTQAELSVMPCPECNNTGLVNKVTGEAYGPRTKA